MNSNLKKLNPYWIVAFVDGEGCFHVGINANKSLKLKKQVLPEFIVVQHQRDRTILKRIQEFFGCGVVRKNHGDRLSFRVRGYKDLAKKIIPFFIVIL